MSDAKNQDLKQLFTQVLKDPNAVSEADFDALFAEYPYAQSLAFAYQRRQADSSTVEVSQKALLHTDNTYWLYEFVHEQPVDKEEEKIVEPILSELSASSQLESASSNELDELILEQARAMDYFSLEDVGEIKETASSRTTPEILRDVVQSHSEEDDDVSVYDDVLMPYSFRWWLFKTRLEHADTYQPFVSPEALSGGNVHVFQKKFDETILDHQIRENIFHLQDPEDKLSDSVKQKTVEVAMPKRTDAIIERFIREEPQIQPPTPDALNNENKARRSAEDRFSLVTETLANIYVEQGLYTKAIDVFKKLISINPEKKLYFASRIEELEQKI